MARQTRLVPGWLVTTGIVIWCRTHHTNGAKAWKVFLERLGEAHTPQFWGTFTLPNRIWLEYGPRHGVEYWQDGVLVEVN